MKKVIVLSLGGSLIIPNDVNVAFLKKFKNIIQRNTKNYKFIIVCGGGKAARRYIAALKEEGLNNMFQDFAGISATRANARFMTYFFKEDPKYGIPHTEKTLRKYVSERNVTFSGALEYKSNQTTDSTSAEIARMFKTSFINLTDVSGLYTANPLTHKDAKFIARIGWKAFHTMANKSKFHPGQHFVLDQTASKMIMQHKIPTYILGKDLKQLEAVLHGKPFKGTLIEG